MAEIIQDGKSSIDTNNGVVSINQNDDNFLFYDGNVYRMLVGLDDDGEPIIKISEEGVSVLDADDDQLIFNSNNNLFKIIDTNTDSVTVPNPMSAGQIVTKTIPHNLGFVPSFIVYGNIPTGGGYVGAGQLTNLPAHLYGSIGSSFGQIVAVMQARADETNLYVDVINPGALSVPNLGTPWTFKYYILQETAN